MVPTPELSVVSASAPSGGCLIVTTRTVVLLSHLGSKFHSPNASRVVEVVHTMASLLLFHG